MTPDVARRLLKGRIESAERQRAEQQVSAATGFPHVRFVQMTLAWLGPADDGPRLSPLYVPAFVYAYSHAGVKVRSFVSGVDGRAAGAHYLDDSKTATLATAAVGGALLLSGAAGVMAPAQLFGEEGTGWWVAERQRCPAIRSGQLSAPWSTSLTSMQNMCSPHPPFLHLPSQPGNTRAQSPRSSRRLPSAPSSRASGRRSAASGSRQRAGCSRRGTRAAPARQARVSP